MKLIDTHSHLHFRGFDSDRSDVHARMAEFGVGTVTVGTAMNTSRDAVAYADAHADTWAAVGFHPEHLTSDHVDDDEPGALDEPFDAEEMARIAASSPRVVAIGETGLDYHRLTPVIPAQAGIQNEKEKQTEAFRSHIAIAAALDKAVIVHMRDAGDDLIRILQDERTAHPSLRVVIHAFTGTWKEATALLDLGCSLGIGGIVTFKPRKGTPEEDALPAIARAMPKDRILFETDAPWLAPAPVRGTRNEPTYVRHVAEFVAGLRGVGYEEMCEVARGNVERCFRI